MKIAYVTTYDAHDVHAWSGTGIHILRALEQAGLQVQCIGNLEEERLQHRIANLKERYYARWQSRIYRRDREPSILKSYASQVKRQLTGLDHDLVFSPGTIPIAYLQHNKPLAFWADATFAGMVGFYPSFSNLCAETIRNGNRLEQMALSHCQLAIYASAWAANSALANYDVDPAKIKVVPFGANIACDRDIHHIRRIIADKDPNVCKLLFLGVDWQRKGGDKALAIATMLHARGVRTELHIAGCNPPSGMPDFVRQHGFISKKTAAGMKRLETLMSECHFLILPARAECYGVVFAEASSFGLPSLATDVGGIPTVVRDGINGYTFPADAPAEAYCDRIETTMASSKVYQTLALSSFQEFSERLNWKTSGQRVRDLLQERVS